jgi:disulfide bond formation protein DsbB
MKARKIGVLIATLALALAACGGGASDSASESGGGGEAVGPGDPVKGAAVYQSTCSACHGPDLAGIDGLGKQLAPSAWVAERSEEEITEFLIVGRAAGDPENTQGVDMPARGGNPSLTDQDLRNVSAYLLAQQ